MVRRKLIYGLALGLTFGAAALGQDTGSEAREAGKHHHSGRRTLDRNADGVVSRDEWRGNDESFAKIDTDRNGILSREELAAARKAWGEHHGHGGFAARMDRNGDGAVARDEWRGNDESFAKIDTNSDGRLTKEELETARGAWRRSSDKTGGRFDALDRNHDGQLSREELGNDSVFERLDRNHDGLVARDELRRPNRDRK
jgi:Ca2+-binding EF-hand superfamily protein